MVGEPNPMAEAPETPQRVDSIEHMMIAMGLEERVYRVEAPMADVATVCLAHDPDYVRDLEAAAGGDAGALARFDAPDTKVGPDTFVSAMKSAGAVVAAVDALMGPKRLVRNAFCAVRPPGHHAGRARACGFCYLNNVAVGALYALKQYALDRVAIVDFDVHHGDGTEEIVSGNPAIRFFSLFQWPLYPNHMSSPVPENVRYSPMTAGADGQALRDILENKWLPELMSFKPQLIILSAGFDAHNEEPMAQLKILESDFAYMTARLLDMADAVCGGRLLSVLEGGYAPRSLARSVMSHLNMLVRRHEVELSAGA